MSDWADDVPEGGRIVAEVWECGDDWCNCCQARISHVSGLAPNRKWTRLWEGKFHTDGEGWAPGGASTELNREARRLRRHRHDLYRRIAWPWSGPWSEAP